MFLVGDNFQGFDLATAISASETVRNLSRLPLEQHSNLLREPSHLKVYCPLLPKIGFYSGGFLGAWFKIAHVSTDHNLDYRYCKLFRCRKFFMFVTELRKLVQNEIFVLIIRW